MEPVYHKKKNLPENFQYIAKKNVEKSGLLHLLSIGSCFLQHKFSHGKINYPLLKLVKHKRENKIQEEKIN